MSTFNPKGIQNTRNEQINLLEKNFLFSMKDAPMSNEKAPLRLPASIDSRIQASKSSKQNVYFTPLKIHYDKPTHVVMQELSRSQEKIDTLRGQQSQIIQPSRVRVNDQFSPTLRKRTNLRGNEIIRQSHTDSKKRTNNFSLGELH